MEHWQKDPEFMYQKILSMQIFRASIHEVYRLRQENQQEGRDVRFTLKSSGVEQIKINICKVRTLYWRGGAETIE